MTEQDRGFDELVSRYLDGLLAADEEARLADALHRDPAARRRFVELTDLHAMLTGNAVIAGEAMARGSGFTTNAAPAGRSHWRRLASAAAALAAAVAVIAGGWQWRASQTVLATVTRNAGVASLPGGTVIRREPHEIEAGAVEFVTARGARVVIEAPATFRFESAQRLRLFRGRLAADVPPAAKGFTVVTPSGDAIDLGTRFGVDVPDKGAAEIHVFEGEVIARPSGARRDRSEGRSLRDGGAVTLAEGTSTDRALRNAAFIQPDEIVGLSAGLAAGQRARAEAAATEMRRDPALVALFDFEADESHAGHFRTVQGRWPGSRAAEFMAVGEHVAIDVGGDRDWPQLTIAMWVRLDRLGEPYQSLLHTDGWSASKPGQVHWIVTEDTTMRLGLYGNKLADEFIGDPRLRLHGVPQSRTSLLPEQGRWVHLVTVYDADAKTVRFFVNGRLDNVLGMEVALPARLGPARIGNWDRVDRKLSGRVDEVLILGRTLGDDEVRDLHDAGTPYR